MSAPYPLPATRTACLLNALGKGRVNAPVVVNHAAVMVRKMQVELTAGIYILTSDKRSHTPRQGKR